LGASGLTVHTREFSSALGHADYVRSLRPHLPREAFRPDPRSYLRIVLHLGIILAGFFAFRVSPTIWWPLIGVAIGVNTAALPFLGHDLSHRTIVTRRYLLYPTELVVWSLLFVPVTLWRRLHNAHHVYLNSDGDPDRAYLTSDRGLAPVVTAVLLYPNRFARYNPLCALFFVAYPVRHIAAMFFNGSPSFVAANPVSSRRDRITILLEVLFMVAFQGLIAYVVSGAYIWASIVPGLMASAVSSWYFFTNHRLGHFHDTDDVLASTTSVAVPGICDVLHSNFSYHTEHHLFPAMNSKYYPMVSRLLQAHFPDRYHRVPMAAAWSKLWRNPILLSPDREKALASGAEEERPASAIDGTPRQRFVAAMRLALNAVKLPALRRL
jgi:fatty acid desaturase